MDLQDILQYVFDMESKCDLCVISSKPTIRKFFFRVVEGRSLVDEVVRHRGFRFPPPDTIYAAGMGGLDTTISVALARFHECKVSSKAMFCCEIPEGRFREITVTQDNKLDILRQHRLLDTLAYNMRHGGSFITEFIKAGDANSIWRPTSLFRLQV